MAFDALEAQGEAVCRDPDSIWQKAQIQAWQAAAERATWPIRAARKVAYMSGALVTAGTLVWAWPTIRRLLDQLIEVTSASSGRAPEPDPAVSLGLAALIMLFPILFGLHDAWAEE